MRFVLVCAHSQVMLLLHTPHVQDKCLCKPSMRNIHTYVRIYNIEQRTRKNIISLNNGTKN